MSTFDEYRDEIQAVLDKHRQRQAGMSLPERARGDIMYQLGLEVLEELEKIVEQTKLEDMPEGKVEELFGPILPDLEEAGIFGNDSEVLVATSSGGNSEVTINIDWRVEF